MKKFFLIITLLIAALFLVTCFSEQDDIIDEDDTMTITLTGLQPVNLNVVNGRVAGAPEDQDTIYVTFRLYHHNEPDYEFKLSPIPDSYDFVLPIAGQGYDVHVCTYPNKLYKFRETWDMPKHIWSWEQDDVGSYDRRIQVDLKRYSSNLIIKAKEGQTIPNDNIKSIRLMVDAVFDNYQPIHKAHFGLYERKWFELWPNPSEEFYWHNICMGLKDPYDSLGTFEFVVERDRDNSWPFDYIKYSKQFQVVGGKTTIIEIDIDQLGVAGYDMDFNWIDEEEDIIIGTSN